MIGFVAFDEILRFFLRGVVYVALKPNVGDNFFEDDAANSSCFRVPFDVIATFEHLGHVKIELRNRTGEECKELSGSPERFFSVEEAHQAHMDRYAQILRTRFCLVSGT
jgi:hypothetical protein